MKVSKENKKESYKLSKPEFSQQERQVIEALYNGYTHAWVISEHTGMLITSVRRALNNLCANPNSAVKEAGKVYYKPTERWVTCYSVQLTLFNNLN